MFITVESEPLWCEICDQKKVTTHITVGVETPEGHTIGSFGLCEDCLHGIGLDLERVKHFTWQE